MRKWVWTGLGLLAVILLAVPTSLFVALALVPLWSWIEETTGVEAIGHAAPATWCFAVTYVAITVPLLGMMLRRAATANAEPSR